MVRLIEQTEAPCLPTHTVILFVSEYLRLKEFSHGLIQIREVHRRSGGPLWSVFCIDRVLGRRRWRQRH
jgi:hypothetical protein